VSVTGVPPTSRPTTKAQALAYAHAVNLRPSDMPGFTSIGSEAEAPEPGQYGLQAIRCGGGVNPARRIVQAHSAEFSAGRAFYGKVVKSIVKVWPTPALVALNSVRSHSSRGRRCLARFLESVHKRLNHERKGRRHLGPFNITIVPDPLPGVSHSFLTTINETLLLRTGAIRAHIYHDIFGFVTGSAEIELEAIGFGHPIPTPTEAKALLLLLRDSRHLHRQGARRMIARPCGMDH
jgi:hypothetical protein